MKYDNTDCLGSVGKYCATFDGSSDYIDFGANNILGDIQKISFRCKLDSTQVAYACIACGILKQNTQTEVSTSNIFFNSNRLNIQVGYKLYYSSLAYTDLLGSANYCLVEITNTASDVPTLTIDGIVYQLTTNSDVSDVYISTSIGMWHKSSGWNYALNGSICDFKCYNSTNQLIHWYPLTEGSGTIAHDVIGTVNGTITASNISNFWANTQDIFTYTVDNRFTPVSFKGKISDNNCATFNGQNQYVLLYNQSMSDVTKVSFTVKINAIHSDASKLYSIFAGFNLRCNFGIRKDTAAHFCLWVGDGEHTGIFEITTLTVTVGSIYNVEISFDYNSGYSCIVNGNSYTLSFVNSNTPSTLNVYTLLGASRNTSNANYQPSYCNLWNFKCYNSNNELIHWYPLAEGANTIAYDAIGNVNGRIVSTLSTFWGTKQNAFAYNAINGFKEDSNQSIAISNAKIPSSKDICIYKSNFGSTVDNWVKGAGTVYTGPSVSNNNLIISRYDGTQIVLNNSSIGSFSNHLTNTYHIKFKVKNTSFASGDYDFTLNGIYITIGYTSDTINSIAYKAITNVGLSTGGTYTVDTDIPLSNKNNTLDTLNLTFKFATNAPDVNNQLAIELSDIELYQTNNYTTYEPITNGIPPCESQLDFTQGIANIAELKNVDSAITIKSPDLIHDNFGADAGSGWTVGTLSASVTSIGNWNANYNGDYSVKYIHNTTLTQTDIDYGITNAIDISTGSNPGGTNAAQFYTTQNFSTYANKTIFIDINFKIKPYEIIPNTSTAQFGIGFGTKSIPLYYEDGTLASESSTEPRIKWNALISKVGYNWTTLHYKGLYTMASNTTNLKLGTTTKNITDQGACALADINLQILPLGVYNKVSDNGYISNLVVYKEAQTEADLARVINHIKHA